MGRCRKSTFDKNLCVPLSTYLSGKNKSKSPAHLAQRAFQRFSVNQLKFSGDTIDPSAQLNLENQIHISFKALALQFFLIPIRD
jgi:hypothetical protein